MTNDGWDVKTLKIVRRQNIAERKKNDARPYNFFETFIINT